VGAPAPVSFQLAVAVLALAVAASVSFQPAWRLQVLLQPPMSQFRLDCRQHSHDSVHFDSVAFFNLNFGQRSGRRRRNLCVDLVGRDLKQTAHLDRRARRRSSTTS
jgi:hypothetical protein